MDSLFAEAVKAISQPDEQDGPGAFCCSVAIRMRKLAPYQQAVVQGKILSVLLEAEFGATQQPHAQPFPSYNQQYAERNPLPVHSSQNAPPTQSFQPQFAHNHANPQAGVSSEPVYHDMG